MCGGLTTCQLCVLRRIRLRNDEMTRAGLGDASPVYRVGRFRLESQTLTPHLMPSWIIIAAECFVRLVCDEASDVRMKP